MIRAKKSITWLVVVAFLANVFCGALFSPQLSSAYDAPPKDQGHTGSIRDQADDGAPPLKICPPAKGSPNSVFLQTGDFAYSHTDLFIPGRGMPLEVTRNYDSQDSYEGPFGVGWKFNLEVSLAAMTKGANETVTIRRWDGVRLDFTRNSDGSYKPPLGRLDQLVKNTDGSYTWSEGGCSGGCAVPRHGFDSSGYRLFSEDPNGNQLSFAYDNAGKLKQVTDATGRKLIIAYGSNNKISSITDPAGRAFAYGYDAAGNLTSYADPAGNTTAYAYDAGHNLTTVTDPRANVVTAVTYDDKDRAVSYTLDGVTQSYAYYPADFQTIKTVPNGSWYFYYNATGQLVKKTSPLGETITLTYDEKLQLTSTTDARGFATTFQYDDRGNRISITDALGNTTTLAYHPTLSLVTSVTDALGRITTLDYDDHGNLIRITDALGNKTRRTYNAYGQVIQEINALGYTTSSYAYDSYGYLNSITDALGNTTSFTHDILGNLTNVTDANGNKSSYVSDILGNTTSFTDPMGNTTTYVYDKNSNMISLTDTYGNSTSYEFDAYNRLTKVTDALGNVTARSYDAMGNVAGETDANANSTSYSYDLVNRLVKKTLADTTSMSFTYDANGNVTVLTDNRGNITSYAFDELNRVKQITYADSLTEQFTYDKVGNPTTASDRKGNTFSLVYDSLNTLVSKTYPDGTRMTFEYDALGRVTSATNTSGAITCTYDKLDRAIKVVQDGQTIGCNYDNVGNTTKLTYSDGSYLAYTYDGMNRLDKIKDSAGSVVADFAYDKLSRRTKLALENGNEVAYKFDDLSRLTDLANKKSSSGSVISSFAYVHDNTTNIKSMTTKAGDHSFTYDKTYQVTQAAYPDGVSTTYNLDAQGNRTSTVNGGTTSYTTNNMNQYTDVGGVPYTYDANGNLTGDGTNTYVYDYENRLVQVVTPSMSIKFAYDAWGRRISRSAGSDIVSYVYFGDRVLLERDKGGDMLAKYVYGVGVDELLKMERGTNNYYLFHNALGNVVNATDGSGSSVESYDYDVYGKATVKNKSGTNLEKSAIGNSYLFTGRDYDTDSGLYNFRARWYDPEMGRFLTPDPMGLGGGDTNLYRYVLNRPSVLVDPAGHVGLLGTVVGGIIGGIGGWWSTGTLKGTLVGGGIGAAAGTVGQFGVSWYGAIGYGALAAGGSNLAWQTMVEEKDIKCVDWWEVGFATGLGGAGGWAFGPTPMTAGATPALTQPAAAMTSKKALEMLFGRMLKDGEGIVTRICTDIAQKAGKAEVKQLANDMMMLLQDPAFRAKWAKELPKLIRMQEILNKIGNSGILLEMRPTKLLPGL